MRSLCISNCLFLFLLYKCGSRLSQLWLRIHHKCSHTNTQHVIKHRALLSSSTTTPSSTSATASSTPSVAYHANVLVSSRANLQHTLQQLVTHDAPRILGRPVLQRRLVPIELDLQERRPALFTALLHHVDVVDVSGKPNDHIALIAT